jgi:2-polyprenyl-6-methoxyphenol hydroxylase-like FAD-dependent oxidoreductase
MVVDVADAEILDWRINMQTVLISGASVAGPALAFWLQRRGFIPTIVERNPALRVGGQAIDIRGVALKVVDQMGLLEQVRSHRTRLRGMTVLDCHGQEVERTTERTLSGGRFDSGDIELFRDDLARILYTATQNEAEYIFGDTISILDMEESSVEVMFESGHRRRFDLVVGADGLNSGVRRLTFGKDSSFVHHLGFHIAIFAAPNRLDLADWQLGFRGENGGFVIYPTRDNDELRVFLYFKTDHFDLGPLDLAQQKALIAERCGWIGGPMPAMLTELEGATDLYLGALAQTRMPAWSSGRIVLVGDAAYCPSPFSGQGTSLALVGAYVLAQELARAGAHPRAFAAYERRMRPFVDLNHAIALNDAADVDYAKNAFDLDE